MNVVAGAELNQPAVEPLVVRDLVLVDSLGEKILGQPVHRDREDLLAFGNLEDDTGGREVGRARQINAADAVGRIRQHLFNAVMHPDEDPLRRVELVRVAAVELLKGEPRLGAGLADVKLLTDQVLDKRGVCLGLLDLLCERPVALDGAEAGIGLFPAGGVCPLRTGV